MKQKAENNYIDIYFHIQRNVTDLEQEHVDIIKIIHGSHIQQYCPS